MNKLPTVNEITQAILNSKTTTFEGRKLPTPQTSGTETQKKMYATMKARQFLLDFQQ